MTPAAKTLFEEAGALYAKLGEEFAAKRLEAPEELK